MGKPATKVIYEIQDIKYLSKNHKSYDISRIVALLGVNTNCKRTMAASLPYAVSDVTVGCENELQTAICGRKENVDLPVSIIESNYYQNILKRAAAGEMSKKVIRDFEEHIHENTGNIWENSWVRFRRSALNSHANAIFETDLLSDKQNPTGPKRNDTDRFVFSQGGEPYIRIPVSYLLKLALADVAGELNVYPIIDKISRQFMGHFLNDNTSPETYSFYPVPLEPRFSMGKGIAHETLARYLLCQSLIAYANLKFGLLEGGQEAMIYFAPNPPIRQKSLNNLIPDSFYRELFMSPCLSGWDRGEEKYNYMVLCHQVLSRSQLNAVKKLKEANIIVNNLVVLPNISNISLANNGTHISLGSRKISELLKDGDPRFAPQDEKYLGDLAIKVVEHFLPLFVGTYSAAPYRLDFSDFHPEKALGFLPHELDFTHLRMIWRRWKKKAKLNVFGQAFTPFGPERVDKALSAIFRLKGDLVFDFRLIDYFMCLMSTDQSPALDGKMGNDIRLRKDLASMGVFDTCMSSYLLYRNRSFSTMGFSGFEGRHYSLFENITEDMGDATNLQALLSCLAFKYMLTNQVSHLSIPDDPTIESERRQIFFGSAIGIPTFFVSKNTRNQFMLKILKKTARIRSSRRYPGYFRIYHLEYKKALIKLLKEDAADLIEMMGVQKTIDGLSRRLESWNECSAAGRLIRGILNETGALSPMELPGDEFNAAAERYYRDTLRKQHMEEAFAYLIQGAGEHEDNKISTDHYCRQAICNLMEGKNIHEFIQTVRKKIINKSANINELKKFICVLMLMIYANSIHSRTTTKSRRENEASIY